MARKVTAFIDPNYHPTLSYPYLEGWLLLYDQIFIGSPSTHQLSRVETAVGAPPVNKNTLTRLIKERWLVPVGRPRFFDEAWRRERTAQFEQADPMRAAHFRWNEDLDPVLAEYKHPLDNEGLDQAIQSAQELDHRHPDAFAWLKTAVSRLREVENALPAKFYTPSELNRSLEETTKGVIYEVAGDIWARRALNATGLVIPRGHERIYGLFDNVEAHAASPLEPKFTIPRPTPRGELSRSDLQLARELTERIARNYTISDVIGDYRKSELQNEFRAWIWNAMEKMRQGVDRDLAADQLDRLFAKQIKEIRLARAIGSELVIAAPAAAIAVLLEQSMTRRGALFLALLKAGEIVGRAFIEPVVEPIIDAAESAVHGGPDRWIALITSARERSR